MAIAKAAVAIVGVVGVATATSLALISSNPQPMPKYDDLSKDTGTSYSSKYAEKLVKYLVGEGTAIQNEANKKSNDAWWEWIFNNRYKQEESKATDEFAKSKIGDDWKKLRAACKDSYNAGATPTNGVITDSTNANKKYKEADIWKFCSPIGQKPTTIKDKDEKYDGTTTMAGKNGHDTKLISVNDKGNDLFWEIRQEEFFATTGDFSGSSAEDNKFFKKFYDLGKKAETTIKDKCKEAYSKPQTGNSPEIKEEELTKYCALKSS